MSRYLTLPCLISAVFMEWEGREKKESVHSLQGMEGTVIQLPNLLLTRTCRSLHFWLAAEVRRDNSSTELGLALL